MLNRLVNYVYAALDGVFDRLCPEGSWLHIKLRALAVWLGWSKNG